MGSYSVGSESLIGEDVILSRLDAAVEAAAIRDRIEAKGYDVVEVFTIEVEDHELGRWEDEGGAVVITVGRQ